MARILLRDAATEVEVEGFIEAVARYEQDSWFLEEILRTRDVDVNACKKNNATVMHVAIMDGGENAARLLLARGPYLDAVCDEGSILATALDRRMIGLAKDLIRLGADIRSIIKRGENDVFGVAVEAACEHGDTEVLDLLLEAGADLRPGPAHA